MPGVFIALHLIEGQLVQPLTVGRRCEVNAVVILLGVWFGYAFWGIAGVLLATPVLVGLKVAAQYQPTWRVLRDFLAPNDILASEVAEAPVPALRGNRRQGCGRRHAGASNPQIGRGVNRV